MTRGNLGDLQPFDPEIDRTFHRLVRHSVHLDYPEHFVPFEHPEHFVISESEHSVVGNFEHPNFEHYSFEHSDFEHSKNMAQPPPRERTLWEMAGTSTLIFHNIKDHNKAVIMEAI